MAYSQQDIYNKIKKFVPPWWFVENKYAPALFQALAAVFAQIMQDTDDQQKQTFILDSVNPYLAVLGAERGKTQLDKETDQQFKIRVQKITSETDKVDLLALINSMLIVPGAKILEAPLDHMFCNRQDAFCNRDNYTDSFGMNYFIVVVPSQQHKPYSFSFNGEAGSFAAFGFNGEAGNNASFVGSLAQDTDIFPNIIKAINDQKAFGMMYSIIESNYSVVV